MQWHSVIHSKHINSGQTLLTVAFALKQEFFVCMHGFHGDQKIENSRLMLVASIICHNCMQICIHYMMLSSIEYDETIQKFLAITF